jgi:hypothetical protein
MNRASDAAPELTEQTTIHRNPKLMTASVHDETVMMDIDGGQYYGLDDIGTVIWQRLESPQSFGALVDGLASEYEADRAVIAADVARLLTLMAERKVVTFDQGS